MGGMREPLRMDSDVPVGSTALDDIEYQFVGYLLPATWTVTIHDVTSVLASQNGDQRRRLIRFSAANGGLSAATQAPRGADVVALRNDCEHAIRSVVATYAFVDRASFDLRLTGVVTSEDAQAFDTKFPTLPPARVDKPELQRICNQEPGLRQALIEFSSGIANPLDTPLHAFRGIEIIRDCVAPGTDGSAA